MNVQTLFHKIKVKHKTSLFVLSLLTSLSCISLPTNAATSTFYNCALDNADATKTNCQPVKVWSFWRSNYAKTKYPIVLAHGALATNIAAGVNFWYNIPETMAKHGATVYMTKQSSFNSSEVRQEQFYLQFQEVLAITGAEKLNLMGHSHGGPSIRYAAHHAPERVASVMAIASPNKGSPVADMVDYLERDVLDGRFGFVFDVVDVLGRAIDFMGGGTGKNDVYATNARDALKAQSPADLARINALYPAGIPTSDCGEGDYEVNGVHYYSWSGVGNFTNAMDPVDWVLPIFTVAFQGEQNDIFVGRCSSHLGRVIRDDYNMNHIDEVNHLFGLVNFSETNPLSVYRKNANLLKRAGL